jgi:hypothetical protein
MHANRMSPKQRERRASYALIGLLTAAVPMLVAAAARTYTLDADFDLGLLDGVNHTAPNSNQLQLNLTGTTFPVLWIANAGEDTLSRIDTNANKETARYRTWFGPAGQAGHVPHLGNAYAGAAPSRTAVDIQGNAYVLNRHFDGRAPVLFKILAEGGIDRNGNGVIDTSSDVDSNGVVNGAEILPMADTNGNGIIEVSELRDERIAWAVRVPDGIGAPLAVGALGRSLCISTDGNLWVGHYNTSRYYKVASSDGRTLSGPHPIGVTPYGCLVDQTGTLWSANLGNTLGKLATGSPATTAAFPFSMSNYGIALGNDKVYLATYSGANGKPYAQFDPATNTFSTPAAVNFGALGVATDGNGNIISGNYVSGGVTKFAPSGAVLWSRPAQAGTGEVRGVAIDANNDVWLIHRTSANLSKYRGTDGTPLGVFPIGDQPYTYSDAAGFAARNITNNTGTWTVVFDGGAAATAWGTVNWTDQVPAGGSVQVQVRAADTQAGLPLQSYQTVSKNAAFSATGRFIQIQTRLNANTTNDSPVLFDLSVTSQATTSCDIDLDGDTDASDIALIRSAIGTPPAAGDPRDANGDGVITANDTRYCALRCTRPSCAR